LLQLQKEVSGDENRKLSQPALVATIVSLAAAEHRPCRILAGRAAAGIYLSTPTCCFRAANGAAEPSIRTNSQASRS